jgi:hypothetical protein
MDQVGKTTVASQRRMVMEVRLVLGVEELRPPSGLRRTASQPQMGGIKKSVTPRI